MLKAELLAEYQQLVAEACSEAYAEAIANPPVFDGHVANTIYLTVLVETQLALGEPAVPLLADRKEIRKAG